MGRARLGLVTAVALLAACGSTSAAPGNPAAASPAPSPATVFAAEDQNGRLLILRVGDTLTVRLGSTYWSIDAGSNPAVLRAASEMSVSPRPGCVPGAGCGVASRSYQAVAAGQAEITASRTSCGEALRCTGDQGSYRVTIIIHQ